jgi:hypothetical protein
VTALLNEQILLNHEINLMTEFGSGRSRMKTGRKINLRVYGPFSACWEGGAEIDIRSEKTRALLAILALSPDGKKSRADFRNCYGVFQVRSTAGPACAGP